MPINIDEIEEGDAFNAASLNSRFTDIENGVNDLASDAIEQHALRSNHLPTMVPYDDFNFVPGPYVSMAGTSVRNCVSLYPVWELVQNGAGTESLQITFDSLTLANTPSASGEVGALLVIVNVHVRKVFRNAAPDYLATWLSGFRIQTRAFGGGAWTTLQHTERWASNTTSAGATNSGARHYFDVPIVTLIKASNVAGALSGIRVQMSALDVPGGWTSPYFEIGEASMTVLPLYGAIT